MAISVDWGAKVIFVPKADTTLLQSVPSEIRELDIDVFRLTLKALEAGENGMVFLDTHLHNPPVTVGGVTIARVVQIINGYTVTFEDGQYAVNLIGANSNIGDVVNVNQVSVRSTNSAGLTTPRESFDRVYVDLISGVSGTEANVGTPSSPSNNMVDAKFIADRENINVFEIYGDQTLTEAFDGYVFYGGGSRENTTIDLNGQSIVNCRFENCTLDGSMNGTSDFVDCHIDDIVGYSGTMVSCGIHGSVTVADGKFASLVNCYSDVPGTGSPRLICGSSGTATYGSVRGYIGGLTVQGIKANDVFSIDADPVSLFLDNTNTGGALNLGGKGYFDNQSVGTAVTTTRFFDLSQGFSSTPGGETETNRVETLLITVSLNGIDKSGSISSDSTTLALNSLVQTDLTLQSIIVQDIELQSLI